MFKRLTFEDAVHLFEQWGFDVEAGPRPSEVTLILDGPGFRTTTVYKSAMLPDIAGVAQEIRWRNGSCFGPCRCEAGAEICASGTRTIPMMQWSTCTIQH